MRPGRGLTLIELLVVMAIILILAGMGWISYGEARTRAKVSASLARLRTVGSAVETYQIDYSAYPRPAERRSGDPYGVLASTALHGLTTPIAYLDASALLDPFGTVVEQFAATGGLTAEQADPFRPPEPNFNPDQSLLYIYYPRLSTIVRRPALNRNGFVVVSIGPDRKDSLIAYYPFPDQLPSQAGDYGVATAHDTVYDPTNGTSSGGDLAWFGGDLAVRNLVGGGK